MRITRGRAWILVHGRPPDRLELSSGWIPRYTEALGAPPRGRVIVHVARAKGSEWLAAEFVLAAEEKWGGRFVLDDFAEEVVTLEEFHAPARRAPERILLAGPRRVPARCGRPGPPRSRCCCPRRGTRGRSSAS